MRAIAFRLLLCLMLVLNGTGYAVAATQMNVAHVAMALAAQEAANNPPCHEEAPAQDAAKTAHSHAGLAADPSNPAAPSCCQSSHCNCDCLQHATAAMSVLAVATPVPPDADIAQPGVVSPIAPALPNLLRPPIA
ncbi:CopL family metal-binding regulatory protein [Lysobacter auxotrophicus]|uniref:CopL family metal-binding regulatory protein n=1 Tax=Lysobacter auxotrophicus TaxID=2992573 RepID=A0ABM8DCY0_9GAMM|nr:CopL family metal-binding regulatory protein [Lysobacter auxotrophicus]BDU16392.1 CopL family metal-binding regulatory protein [Lysobacter auxotrophicus]